MTVVRQDISRTGFIEALELNHGKTVLISNLTVTFDWPYVEITSDITHNEVYMVVFPDNSPGPELYQLDGTLAVKNKWDSIDFSFFDLQHSSTQNTLYGILVTSTYGRVLSNFSLTEDSIVPTELFTLPYMWYVNASTFHQSTCRYFALINNFPGFENSTLDQQLVVADFSKEGTTDADVVPITGTSSLIQFISFSSALETLYCAGTTDSGSPTAHVYTLGLDGVISNRLFSTPGIAVGPLLASDSTDELFLFVKNTNEPAQWSLWAIPYDKSKGAYLKMMYLGDEYVSFSAASMMV